MLHIWCSHRRKMFQQDSQNWDCWWQWRDSNFLSGNNCIYIHVCSTWLFISLPMSFTSTSSTLAKNKKKITRSARSYLALVSVFPSISLPLSVSFSVLLMNDSISCVNMVEKGPSLTSASTDVFHLGLTPWGSYTQVSVITVAWRTWMS